jgi:hypothetical protein
VKSLTKTTNTTTSTNRKVNLFTEFHFDLTKMPYCENCGKFLTYEVKFCGNCGTPLIKNQVIPPPPPPLPLSQTSNPLNQSTSEQILSFIIAQLTKRFGNPDYYTGVLTNQRLIFVPMTKNMLKEVSEISRQKAKGKVSPEPIIYPYQQSYLSMSPSTIIACNPSCLVIENNGVLEINLATVGAIGDGYSDTNEFELKIKSVQGNYTFRLTKRDEYVTRLKQIYQNKIRLF